MGKITTMCSILTRCIKFARFVVIDFATLFMVQELGYEEQQTNGSYELDDHLKNNDFEDYLEQGVRVDFEGNWPAEVDGWQKSKWKKVRQWVRRAVSSLDRTNACEFTILQLCSA